jgi:potassium/hydrogen antiporter
MITAFVTGLSLLVLVCFIIDILADKIKVPGVILLMGVGIIMHYSFNALYIEKAIQILPILGTFALILVVIEAGFDLDYESEKRTLILKALASAACNLSICLIPLTLIFQWYYETDLIKSLIYAIPFSIVSSAIAIPSAKSLDADSKEFLTYETVFSDVFGILLFNLFLTSTHLDTAIIFSFTGSLIFSILLSFALSMILIFVMKHVKHKIRFVPIFSALILIYALGKYLHLPLLITMMVFGLVLNNIEKLEFPIFHIKINKRLKVRINHFKRLTHELTFVIRGLFFVMFGYRLDLMQFLNPLIILAAIGLIVFVFATRFAILKSLRSNLSPGITFIAPRGLISILLMLSIPEKHAIAGFDGQLLDIFIIATILIQLATRNYADNGIIQQKFPRFLANTMLSKLTTQK